MVLQHMRENYYKDNQSIQGTKWCNETDGFDAFDDVRFQFQNFSRTA